MSVRALLTYCYLTFVSAAAWAQGFAGLGSDAEGFSVPKPGTALAFPADHGAHTDFRIEWWYITANLRGADEKDYGVQWTLFRSAHAPFERGDWSSPQVWTAHAAITTPSKHFVAERFARGGIGQAGVSVAPFSAWIDDWQMVSRAGADADPLSRLEVRATAADFSYDLELLAEGPLVLQGQDGYSVKSEKGQASYYYSQPFYRVTGTLNFPDGPLNVTGQAWLDREWSSQPLASDQTGWDWFSLHFDTGEKLMAFRLRSRGDPFTAATWIEPNGRTEAQVRGALRVIPLETTVVAGRDIPIRWRLELPAKGVRIESWPLNSQSWMTTQFPYWEGPITFSGTHKGRGYLEMTGYE
jgi:predicted secreted hydrolase